MIDLHIHLLPGVDDGPTELAESVAQCRAAGAQGCTDLIATPHQRHYNWWNTDEDELRRLLAAVQEEVGPTPMLHLGAEVRVDSELLSVVGARSPDGVSSLAGSEYLLVEFDRMGLGPDPEETVHELTTAGWRPIVAHPEFVPQLRDVERAAEVTRLGGYLQLTGSSLVGDFGRKIKTYAETLLDRGIVQFVASDSHGLGRRPPNLDEAYDRLDSRYGATVARSLLVDNPRAVLENRPI